MKILICLFVVLNYASNAHARIDKTLLAKTNILKYKEERWHQYLEVQCHNRKSKTCDKFSFISFSIYQDSDEKKYIRESRQFSRKDIPALEKTLSLLQKRGPQYSYYYPAFNATGSFMNTQGHALLFTFPVVGLTVVADMVSFPFQLLGYNIDRAILKNDVRDVHKQMILFLEGKETRAKPEVIRNTDLFDLIIDQLIVRTP